MRAEQLRSKKQMQRFMDTCYSRTMCCTALRSNWKTLFYENYTPITYRQVYSFFSRLKGIGILNANESKYLDEFLDAMEIHTKEMAATEDPPHVVIIDPVAENGLEKNIFH